MKKIALSLFVLTSAFAVKAQNVDFQVRAGVNFQNINTKIGSTKDEGKLKTGFHVGAEVAIPIADEFYIQPGLLFSQKGTKGKDDNSDVKTSISYLEVPVNFVYKSALGSGKLLLGVGPYVGFGIGGKIKSNDGSMDIKFKNKVNATDVINAAYLKRLDFGGNLLAGYQFTEHIFSQLNFQLGMSNIFPKVEGAPSGYDYSAKNTGFGLSVGYKF